MAWGSDRQGSLFRRTKSDLGKLRTSSLGPTRPKPNTPCACSRRRGWGGVNWQRRVGPIDENGDPQTGVAPGVSRGRNVRCSSHQFSQLGAAFFIGSRAELSHRGNPSSHEQNARWYDKITNGFPRWRAWLREPLRTRHSSGHRKAHRQRGRS